MNYFAHLVKMLVNGVKELRSKSQRSVWFYLFFFTVTVRQAMFKVTASVKVKADFREDIISKNVLR